MMGSKNGDTVIRSSISTNDVRASRRPLRGMSGGFTVVELLVAMVIGVTLTAMAVPMITSTVSNYQKNAAVAAVTGAIRSARYAAIYQGNTFRIKFTQATGSYQLSSAPTNTAVFTNVGSAVPLSGSLGGDTTLELHSSGLVKPIPANAAMAVVLTTNGVTETITVSSSYGDISVAP